MIKELKKIIKYKSIPNLSSHLLYAEDALEIVKHLKKYNARLGGFDGFYLHENGNIQIEQVLSPDYSKFSDVEAQKMAIEFFTEHLNDNKTIGYELVIIEKK